MLSHVLYSASDIQDYFEYIMRKHDTFTDRPPVRIYVNKIENKITFEIKTVSSWTFAAWNFEITWQHQKWDKRWNCEHVPNLKLTKVVLVQCSILSNDHLHINSRVLYTFVSNKSLGQLLDISPKSFIFFKAYWSVVYWSKF